MAMRKWLWPTFRKVGQSLTWPLTTAAQHGIEPLTLLTDYLQACAQNGGTAPAGAGLDPFLPWTPQGRARRRPASDPRQGPGP